MLGLDTGWNCYISLGDDVKAGSQHQQQKENFQEDVFEKNSYRTSSSHLSVSHNKRTANYKKKSSISKPQKMKLFHQKKRLFNQHKNYSFTQSMPILKYSKPKECLYTDGGTDGGASDNTSLIGLSSQIVKFDLSNLTNKRRQQLKKRKTTERKLFRFEYDEEEDDEGGKDDVESSESSDDSDLNFNGQRKKSIFHMNSKTSMTSSNKYNQKLNSLSVSSNKYQDDENSSHQTNHSGRTLSETEILGNAVSKILILQVTFFNASIY